MPAWTLVKPSGQCCAEPTPPDAAEGSLARCDVAQLRLQHLGRLRQEDYTFKVSLVCCGIVILDTLHLFDQIKLAWDQEVETAAS